MTLSGLRKSLAEVKLEIVTYSEGEYSVGCPAYANPMLFFDDSNKGEKYNGTIHFKAINAPLFSSTQIVTAIKLVNNYLKDKN